MNEKMINILQIFFIVITLLSSTLPNFLNLRKDGNKNGWWWTLFACFLISLPLSVILTIVSIETNERKNLEEIKTSNEIIEKAKINIGQSESTFKRVNISINKLEHLQNKFQEMSDSLLVELNLQKSLNRSSSLLVNNMLDQNRKTIENDSLNLERCIYKLSFNIVETFIYPSIKNISKNDSLMMLTRYKTYAKETREAMNAQISNDFLLRNPDLLRIWSDCLSKLNDLIYLTNGYGLSSLQIIIDKTNNLNSIFKRLPAAYEEEKETTHKVLKYLKLNKN